MKFALVLSLAVGVTVQAFAGTGDTGSAYLSSTHTVTHQRKVRPAAKRLPFGCIAKEKVSGTFICGGGEVIVRNGWTNVAGQSRCAFTTPKADAGNGEIYLSIDNPVLGFAETDICQQL